MSKDSWSPDQYEKFKAERSQPFYDLMAFLRPSPGARVIDLGCGTGELTAELHRHLQARSTLGLDSSDEMLKKAASFSGQGLNFNKGDLACWRTEQAYDIVFSNAALIRR